MLVGCIKVATHPLGTRWSWQSSLIWYTCNVSHSIKVCRTTQPYLCRVSPKALGQEPNKYSWTGKVLSCQVELALCWFENHMSSMDKVAASPFCLLKFQGWLMVLRMGVKLVTLLILVCFQVILRCGVPFRSNLENYGPLVSPLLIRLRKLTHPQVYAPVSSSKPP